NASIGHFASRPELYHGPAIEMTITVFMVLAGANFMLLYWLIIFRPRRLLADVEWRTYVGILFAATVLVVAIGLWSGDFDGTNGMHKQGAETIVLPPGGQVHVGRDGQVDVRLPATGSATTDDSPRSGHVAVLVPQESHIVRDHKGRLRIRPGDDQAGRGEQEDRRLDQAIRFGLFQVVSIMTTTGYCTDNFDLWNSFNRGLLLVLMFIGGCAGSTGGGLKVIRHILLVKILRLEIEHAFHPTVVRPLWLGGRPVEDPELRRNILVYFALIVAIFVFSWLFTITVEPEATWTEHGHEVEHKLIDAASCVAATLNNIGPGLGVIGATKNYSNFTWPTKLLFIWLMMLGRLELFVILVLFVPGFWRSQ
ncbi:MAG TPA: TrkH family potassium uptake protein, partial [Planctomycetaceae bacterium]|nr:TrkH family potassium uptake protein [Planctomycetaceae bacterium]